MNAYTSPNCTAPETTTEEADSPRPAPVELPAEPRRFLACSTLGPQDCTLHPDGTVTMRAGGQVWRSAFTFAEMREMDDEGQHWADHRITWDPTDDDVARATQTPPETGQGDLFATPTAPCSPDTEGEH